MFRINNFFPFFRAKVNKNNLSFDKLTLQQLYNIYNILNQPLPFDKKYQKQVKNFLLIYYLLATCDSSNSLTKNTTVTFLSLFFLEKTFKINFFEASRKFNQKKLRLSFIFFKTDSSKIDFKKKGLALNIFGNSFYKDCIPFYQNLKIIIKHRFYPYRILLNTPSVILSKPLLIEPKFNTTSINAQLNSNSVNGFEFYYLRKNKVYNKGRYSRCRQNYRTGVYMCMYLSIVSIFGLYYWFYKFSFNFTYLWWFFIAFIASFFFPKIVKYRLYEPSTLFFKFVGFFKWCSLLIRSFF